jgi:hypothetical protein
VGGQRPVQVEQADAEIDRDVQSANEHRKEANPMPADASHGRGQGCGRSRTCYHSREPNQRSTSKHAAIGCGPAGVPKMEPLPDAHARSDPGLTASRSGSPCGNHAPARVGRHRGRSGGPQGVRHTGWSRLRRTEARSGEGFQTIHA